MNKTDGELLGRYARDRSEGAFEELVRRHIDLVYAAALRQVNGDAHEAEDVTQAVFADLARKAASLARHPSDVPYRSDVTRLGVWAHIEGFADARLLWRPEMGEAIPASYVLRLDRPVPIGGRVGRA